MMIEESILIQAELQKLEAVVKNLRAENSEVNRRLSVQNRPGLQVASCIQSASTILAAHIAGENTSRSAMLEHYEIGRRRWLKGVGLLKLSSVVVSSSTLGLTFNGGMTIQRSWQKLYAMSQEIANDRKGLSILSDYIPRW